MNGISNCIVAIFLCIASFDFVGCSVFADTKADKPKPVATIKGNRGWLDNGVVKVAVDKKYGGSIVYASTSESKENMVNIHDKGRQIQQSYYAGKSLDRKAQGQSSHWTPWAWNPVQAGNFDGDKSVVLNFEAIENGTVVYTKCQPRLWDMNEELAKCTFSQWMQFEEGMKNVIRVTNTIECFRDKDDIWGSAVAVSQELPAVYAIRNMSRMVIYDGDKPWTNAPPNLVRYKSKDQWIWTKQKPTEPWAACVHPKTNIGFGVYSPAGANNIWNMGWTGRRKEADEKGGTEYSASTMHFASIAQWKLDRDTKRTFCYWIIIGQLDDIRSQVYQLHKQYPEG